MHRFKFEDDDLFINRLRTYPEYNVFIYQGQQYTNNFEYSGSGGISVFDINANRTTPHDVVVPHVSASLRKDIFKNLVYNPLVEEISSPNGRYKTRQYWTQLSTNKLDAYPTIGGTPITGNYGNASQIKRRIAGAVRSTQRYWNLETGQLVQNNVRGPVYNVTASALQNVAKKYTILSDHFIFGSSSVRSRNLLQSTVNFIFIPSMYYGTSIKKGSVKLQFLLTGSIVAECSDQYENGVLIETTGTAQGNVVGVVLYDEGVIMLTASHNLETGPSLGIRYTSGVPLQSSWLYYGATLNDGITTANILPWNTLASASYNLDFKGVSYVNTMTMFAHAKKGGLNHSNNPTYRKMSDTRNSQTGSGIVFAEGETDIKNIVSASFTSASFEKTTYISKINIYDENENLIGVASLANPVKKTIDREYLFKLKLDI